MKIKKINWISQEALEAEVVVTDGEFEVLCFAQPLNYLEESEIKDPIYCFSVSNIVKAEKKQYSIKKSEDYFAYRLIGKVIDKHNEKVKLGELLLELDNTLLPGDINDGDFISFSCQRLDIY